VFPALICVIFYAVPIATKRLMRSRCSLSKFRYAALPTLSDQHWAPLLPKPLNYTPTLIQKSKFRDHCHKPLLITIAKFSLSHSSYEKEERVEPGKLLTKRCFFSHTQLCSLCLCVGVSFLNFFIFYAVRVVTKGIRRVDLPQTPG
jgi:hypothetical protein